MIIIVVKMWSCDEYEDEMSIVVMKKNVIMKISVLSWRCEIVMNLWSYGESRKVVMKMWYCEDVIFSAWGMTNKFFTSLYRVSNRLAVKKSLSMTPLSRNRSTKSTLSSWMADIITLFKAPVWNVSTSAEMFIFKGAFFF